MAPNHGSAMPEPRLGQRHGTSGDGRQNEKQGTECVEENCSLRLVMRVNHNDGKVLSIEANENIDVGRVHYNTTNSNYARRPHGWQKLSAYDVLRDPVDFRTRHGIDGLCLDDSNLRRSIFRIEAGTITFFGGIERSGCKYPIHTITNELNCSLRHL